MGDKGNPMHIIVCLKQVPDTTEVKIDPKTNTLIRQGVPSIANPFDVNAIEAAMSIKDTYGAKLTVISMGPPQAKEALRKGISFGADQAILISDRVFAGADTLATSYALSQVILKLKQADGLDLVICGKQAIDGDTAQVGPGIATRLNLTQLTYVSKIRSIDVKNRKIIVERKHEDGIEIVEGALPALLTVVKEINTPRYATLPNLIKAIQYEPLTWSKNDFEAEPSKLGLEGSATWVEKIFTPSLRAAGSIFYSDKEGFENEIKNIAGKLKDTVNETKKMICI